MNHGGRREGAGRPAGLPNRRTREIAERAIAEGLTPLEYLLQVMRADYPEDAPPELRAKHDSLRLEAAKSVAPYIHPRLGIIDSPIKLPPLAGTLAEQGYSVLNAMTGGALTPNQAQTLLQVLTAQARIVEVDELERRITALEER